MNKKYPERLTKLGWFFSVVLFLLGKLYAYTLWPQPVRLLWNVRKEMDKYIDKELIFYISIGGFILFNLFWMIVRNMVKNLAQHNKLIYQLDELHIRAWVYSFNLIVNVSSTLYLLYLAYVNKSDSPDPHRFTILFYFFLTLSLGWIIWLVTIVFRSIILIKKNG